MSSYNHIWANRFAGLLKSVWTTLILCLTANQALGDQLVLFNVPSPAGINWNTPHTLLKSVVQNHNSGMSHEIGHVFVGVEKVNQDCKQRHLAGTIYKKDGEKEVVTKMGCPVCK